MSDSGKQNIVLVSWDSVRADHLPMYGYERDTTPFLDKLARQGLVFEDTHVSGVGTPTSFTGTFTGKHAHADQTCITPSHWRSANKNRRLLSEALQDAGYYTGGIHANALMCGQYGWDRGWDYWRDNQWTEANPESEASRAWNEFKKSKLLPRLRKYGLSGLAIHGRNLVLKKESYANWEDLWKYVEEFMAEAPEPWFLWVLLVDTHHPWHPPEAFKQWRQPGFRRLHFWNYVMRRYPEFTGRRREGIVNAYDNELRHADAFLHKLYDAIGKDAAWIVHSDHGDELGEHNDYGHRPAMWDTVTRVPLVMHNVGKAGHRSGPHSLLDLGSTILDLAGSTERLNSRPSLFERESNRSHVYIENRRLDGDRIAAVVHESGWKAIYTPEGGYQAYNRQEDKWEKHDVLTEPERYVPFGCKTTLELLQEELESRRESEHDIGIAEGESSELDGVHENLANLGYLE